MWDKQNFSEVACSLASLILFENNIPLSDENFEKIFKITSVKVEIFWYSWFFSKLLVESNQIGATSDNTGTKTESKQNITREKSSESETKLNKIEKQEEEEKEESDEDMGFGLFD